MKYLWKKEKSKTLPIKKIDFISVGLSTQKLESVLRSFFSLFFVFRWSIINFEIESHQWEATTTTTKLKLFLELTEEKSMKLVHVFKKPTKIKENN